MGAVLEGYEPKRLDCAVMARSLSLPSSRGQAAGAVEVNPFYSERLRQEMVLQSKRPGHLPAVDDGDEGRVPLMHDVGPPAGKGHGGDVACLFTTPQSLERPTVFGPKLR